MTSHTNAEDVATCSLLQQYVVKHLAEKKGVLIIDETGFPESIRGGIM